VATAYMASGGNFLAASLALGASSLELLNEARHDLLIFNNLSFTVASRAVVNVVWIISSTASAVRADSLLVVS
jgi:hypothetical protein